MYRSSFVRFAQKAGHQAAAVQVAKKHVAKGQVAVPPPQVSTMANVRNIISEGLRHVYHGFRLFFINTRLAWRYSRQLKRGVALTRRERLLLESSTKDLLRLVPFSFFIVVPFAELLLPVALKMFPGLIPSTFESESQGRNRVFGDALGTLRARQRVMEFVSATALATFNSDQQEVIRRSVVGDTITPKDIRLIAPFFSRTGPFSVYEIPDSIAVGLGRIVGVYRWYHSLIPTTFAARSLRGRIIQKYHTIREDDRIMRMEGIDKLDDEELVKANVSRGMRWTETPDTLRVQLEWWNSLSRDPVVPYNTLFWIKPTRYSLRKSMNSLPIEQRRQMLGIQNMPESVRSSLEALCETVDSVRNIEEEPITADKIAEKVADITDSAKMGDKDIANLQSIGAYLTEETVKKMFTKLRKNKSEGQPVLVSEVIEAVGHETHNSTHVVSNLFDTFDYGAGSKPISEATLISIGARCRAYTNKPAGTEKAAETKKEAATKEEAKKEEKKEEQKEKPANTATTTTTTTTTTTSEGKK
ncbi:hypothetical protein STCU_09026 [Strigomonas culicis]|uniref:Letm1 RBD domain-containing protein n=1 Tax=Strigomonas culicis TaxID=28005 RepID=S9VBD0_9TRYP|nr:hypothetical protein STCU_09026 [Strigomonas culicis]|eukprot:EPY20370.1 hypothetical protein STCU_09026 [Strigomonas culicis]